MGRRAPWCHPKMPWKSVKNGKNVVKMEENREKMGKSFTNGSFRAEKII
jgi:hypothetical protein